MSFFKKSKVIEKLYHIAFPKDMLQQQFKGEIEQQNTITNKKAGEEHPFDYRLTEGVYLKVPLVTGTVDKLVDFVWGPGFFTTSKDKRAKDIIDQWIKDVDFDSTGRHWLREALIKGSGYLELGGGKNESPQGVKVLNANNMFVKRDSKGKILEYNQQIGKVIGKVIRFEPFQIAHLSINQLGDSPYGWGIVYPVINTINHLIKAENDMHKLVERKANSPVVATLGNEMSPPTSAAIDDFAGKLNYMNAKTEWVVPADVKMSLLDFGRIGEKFSEVLGHDKDMMIAGLQVPEVLLGKGNIAEGLANVQMDAFERRASSFQVELEKVIESKIFKRVLQSNGLDAHVEFNWGQPSKSEQNEQIQRITVLLQNPFLNSQLRFELEKILAKLFDIDEAKIKPEEIAREEEETEPQPRVPGSNQKLYLGELEW